MDVERKSQELQRVRGAVRGRFRSALLGWTDPESGERLTVDLHGSDSFLQALERMGFEHLADAAASGRAQERSFGSPGAAAWTDAARPGVAPERADEAWEARAQLVRRQAPGGRGQAAGGARRGDEDRGGRSPRR